MYHNFLNILHEAFKNLIPLKKTKLKTNILSDIIKALLMSKIGKPKLIKNIAMIITLEITK